MSLINDTFYNYSRFDDNRVTDIFRGWDGLGGYHGLLIKQMAIMVPDKTTVLDVGCGACHLLDALKILGRTPKEYVGIELDDRILSIAKEKHSEANLIKADFHTLNLNKKFEVVIACGLYSGEPERDDGVSKLLEHTEGFLVLTYFAKKKGVVPKALTVDGWGNEFIIHKIDDRLEIMRMWRIRK